MEYLEFLEHAKTLLEAYDRETQARLGSGRFEPHPLQVIESEIQNEHQRGELALKLAEPPPQEILERFDTARAALTPYRTATEESREPFRCTQCGDAIWYGERQHVCRGGK